MAGTVVAPAKRPVVDVIAWRALLEETGMDAAHVRLWLDMGYTSPPPALVRAYRLRWTKSLGDELATAQHHGQGSPVRGRRREEREKAED